MDYLQPIVIEASSLAGITILAFATIGLLFVGWTIIHSLVRWVRGALFVHHLGSKTPYARTWGQAIWSTRPWRRRDY